MTRSVSCSTAMPKSALTADQFATRLESALSKTDDAIFEWLTAGQPKPADKPPVVLGPNDVDILLPVSSLSGHKTRAQGAPASDVLEPLAEFLEAHRDENVVVEWRVQQGRVQE